MKVNRSSHILDLTHDENKNELHVTFHNGKVYTYPGVSAKEYMDLLNAPSIGTHFAQKFRHKKSYSRKK